MPFATTMIHKRVEDTALDICIFLCSATFMHFYICFCSTSSLPASGAELVVHHISFRGGWCVLTLSTFWEPKRCSTYALHCWWCIKHFWRTHALTHNTQRLSISAHNNEVISACIEGWDTNYCDIGTLDLVWIVFHMICIKLFHASASEINV